VVVEGGVAQLKYSVDYINQSFGVTLMKKQMAQLLKRLLKRTYWHKCLRNVPYMTNAHDHSSDFHQQ